MAEGLRDSCLFPEEPRGPVRSLPWFGGQPGNPRGLRSASGTPPAGPLDTHPLRTRAACRSGAAPPTPVHIRRDGEGPSCTHAGPHHRALSAARLRGWEAAVRDAHHSHSPPFLCILSSNRTATLPLHSLSLTGPAHRCGPNWHRRKDAGHSPRGGRGAAGASCAPFARTGEEGRRVRVGSHFFFVVG